MEYRGKWLKLQLFQIRNGILKKSHRSKHFFDLLYPKQTYFGAYFNNKNVGLRLRFFAKKLFADNFS